MSQSERERLDLPRDMHFIAKMSDWDTDETRRKLKQLDKELGGKLLTKIGTRYYVTIAQLRQHWPQFGKRIASADDLTELQRQLAELRKANEEKTWELRDVRKRLRALEAEREAAKAA